MYYSRLKDFPEIIIHPIDMNLASTDIIAQPAMQVSSSGSLLENQAVVCCPIWVTGFIASEPLFDIDSLPYFL